MRKSAYELFFDYMIALVLGVIYSIPFMFLFGIFLPSGGGHEFLGAFLGFSFFALIFAPILAPLVAFPGTILGYLVAIYYYRRNITSIFVWINSGFLIGILNGFAFSLSNPFWIPVFAITGTFVAYFMWRRA